MLCLIRLPDVNGMAGDSTYADSTDRFKSRHITGGGGWAWHALRDMGMSPLYYSGSHIYGLAGYEAKSRKLIHQFSAGFIAGAVSPSIYPELTGSRMKSITADAGYSFFMLAGGFGSERGKWFLGGTLAGQFAYYRHNLFTNSAVNQYFLSSAGINSRLSYPFGNPGREFTMVLQVHIPIVTAVLRNSYAYIKPSGFLDHDNGKIESFFESLEVFTVNRFSGAGTSLYIEYMMQNYNIWRFGYRWDYFSHRNVNHLEAATHGLYLQLMLNL